MPTEKSPLLSNEGGSNLFQYGQSTEGDVERQTTCVTVTVPTGHLQPPLDSPPPYSPSHDVPIICQVCGFMIDISNRKEQHVVKCSSCNEATPIKNAPPGKKYVRCPCNCLLICKSSSQRISCPRNNCKKIISLAPAPATFPPVVPGMCQVSCAHCHNLFLFNTLNNALARCPHCRKVSSVGRQFSRSYGIIYIVFAFGILIAAIGTTVSTYHYAEKNAGMYSVYIGLFGCFLITFYKAIRYFTMKVSNIEGPM